MEFDGLRLDGVLWVFERGRWNALCPKHHIRLEIKYNGSVCHMACAEDKKEKFIFEREYNAQLRYVQNKVDSKNFKKLKYVNIDGEYTPIAENHSKSENGKFFVHAILTDTKVGLRMVVYAGEKGKEKTQIFVEPDIKRLAFDQTNTHPSEVFIELIGTFDDGSSASIRKAKT